VCVQWRVLRIAHTQHTLTCASSMAQARGSQGTTPTTQANTRTTRSNQGSPQPPGSTGQTSPSRGAAALGVTTAAKRLPPPLPSLRTLRTRFQPVGVLAKKTLAKNPAKAQRENQGQGEPGQHRDGEGVCLPRMHCLPLVATRAAHARAARTWRHQLGHLAALTSLGRAPAHALVASVGASSSFLFVATRAALALSLADMLLAAFQPRGSAWAGGLGGAEALRDTEGGMTRPTAAAARVSQAWVARRAPWSDRVQLRPSSGPQVALGWPLAAH
jgi:hypothetical protein